MNLKTKQVLLDLVFTKDLHLNENVILTENKLTEKCCIRIQQEIV